MKPYGSKRSFDTDPRIKSGRALVKREGEAEIDASMPDDDNDSCTGVIPGTFIACGEGGNYCSEECERKARFKAAQERVLEEYADTFEKLAEEE